MAQAQDRKITAPPINVETQAFWDAAAQGQALDQEMHGVRRGAFLPPQHLPVLLFG